MPDKKPFERLPANVVPSNYAITLKPDLKAFTFEGSEVISVKIKENTDTIVLNSVDIEIQEARFSQDGKEFGECAKVVYAKEDEKVSLQFSKPIEVGNGSLSVVFTGELNDKLKGFYRSKYKTPDGEERYAAVTQFEATDARRAFPCWDEPAVKATFDMTLTVPKDFVALSNMPPTSEDVYSKDDNLKVVQYERTPIMSTYLLAFIVGEYDYVEDTDSDGVKVRVYTPTGKKEQGQFALEVAVKTLPFYHNYFDVAYPLPKLDLIALPDFAAGAMENWGLVTYRETALLIDPKNSSSSSRQWVALVVGHEIAHQWFGNLVTMEWWTHLWLNEGFASWIEYLCVDHCFPEFDIWTQFASNDFTRALDLDALKSSHPIEVPVGHPDEVDEIFDLISYSKGASIIRMLHDFIGDEDYKKGMHDYLTKHKYTNTMTEDLWDALGSASNKPVNEIMSTWTKQMGFPVLKVSQKEDGNKRILTIKQEKFCADGKLDGVSPLWSVPVSISTASNPFKAAHRFVLKEEEATITLNDIKTGDWLKLNTGSVGFYRTQYSSDMLEALLPAVKDQTMPPRDRLGLQNDIFALARSGEASTVDVLKLAQAFQKETNYTVWSDLSSNLSTVSLLLQHTDFHDSFKSFICNLFSDVSHRLGWDPKEGEGHLDALLRSLMIGSLGRNGHQPTIEEAKKKFAAHCDQSSNLLADLRAPVYTTVLSHGGESEFNELLKLFKAADLHEEKVRLMRSLGSTKEKALIDRTLEFALSEEVRSQDTVFVIAGVTGSYAGRKAAWKFVQDNWTVLHDRYQGGFLLSRLVMATTENFASEDSYQEVKAFFEAHPAPAAERKIQQSLENIQLNIAQLKRDKDAIQEFLAA